MSMSEVALHYNPECPYASMVRKSDRELVLIELAASVWDSMLQLPIVRTEPEDESASAPDSTLTAVVNISGAWQGTLALTTLVPYAVHCAEALVGATPGELSANEVQDAWGEIANMLAGNLKALVLHPSQLSLPNVISGSTYSFRVPKTRVLNEVTFASDGNRFRMTVLQLEPPQDAAQG